MIYPQNARPTRIANDSPSSVDSQWLCKGFTVSQVLGIHICPASLSCELSGMLVYFAKLYGMLKTCGKLLGNTELGMETGE